MEKRRPHHDLDAIQRGFTTVASLRMTRTAQDFALQQGWTARDVVEIIWQIGREQFYKSMTSLQDASVWQDVYHVAWADAVLYVKFTTDPKGYLVVSLKWR